MHGTISEYHKDHSTISIDEVQTDPKYQYTKCHYKDSADTSSTTHQTLREPTRHLQNPPDTYRTQQTLTEPSGPVQKPIYP